MGFKNLRAELEEMFGEQAGVSDSWDQHLKRTVDERLFMYARIKRYLKTPKGKEALRRYQAQPHVVERRRQQQRERRSDPHKRELERVGARASYADKRETEQERCRKYKAENKERVNATRRLRYARLKADEETAQKLLTAAAARSKSYYEKNRETILERRRIKKQLNNERSE